MRKPVLVLVGVIAGACSGTPETSSTVDSIRSRDKIVVGINFEPGLGLRNPETHRFEGFDVSIAELMAVGLLGGTREDLGDRIEFVETLAKDRESSLDNGNVDVVVATYTINDERKQVVDFAGPYLVAHQDIMVAAGDDSIRGVADLNGRKVCTASGTTSATNLAAKAPQAELTLLDTLTECTEALGAGQVAAVSTDDVILAGLIANGGGRFKMVNAPFTDEPYGIGLPRGDDRLREVLIDRLTEIERSGEWADAFAASLGKLGLPTPPPPPIDRYPSPTSTTRP
ncbi:MAG: glutamate ABC transporter substrate-binding protein [Acidimicrobiales bacterium]